MMTIVILLLWMCAVVAIGWAIGLFFINGDIDGK